MMRSRLGHRIAATAMVLAMTAVLASCASPTDRSWQPAAWPVEGRVLDALPDAEAPLIDLGATVPVDYRLRNDEVGIDARWAGLPGDQPVNARIEQVIREAITAREDATGAAYHPQAFPVGAGLAERGCTAGATQAPAAEILGDRTGAVVVCEVVFASGTIFGEAVRIVTGAPDAIESDTTTTIYTDIATGVVAASDELVNDPSALWEPYVEVLRRAYGSLSIAPVTSASPEQLAVLTSALGGAVLQGGEFVIPVPADVHAAELDGLRAWQDRDLAEPRYVALSTAAIETALSPLGAAVASASGPFAGPVSQGAGFEPTPCDLMPCMAMTLDDGPSSLTPGFLDALRDQDAAATFFMLGQSANAYPDTVRRVAAEGHQIGNHTWNHPYLTALTDREIQSQLGRTRELLQSLSGQPIATFRPPGGFVNNHVVAVAGQPAIMWSVDTRDWAAPDDASLAALAISEPKPGTIILMHDIQKGTSRVFAQVIAGLRDRGFALVTIDALFGSTVPQGIIRHGPTP